MNHIYKGLTIEIKQDMDPSSPREWDNYGTIAAFHRRYSIGDKHSFLNPKDLESYITKSKAIFLPVYMIDHGGIALSTRDYRDAWDSGQVGFIYIERAKVMEIYKTKRIDKKLRAQVEEILRQEIATYSQFLEGDVWGYIVKSESGEHIGSCWGFFGQEYALEEAKEEADHWIKSNESGLEMAKQYGMGGANG